MDYSFSLIYCTASLYPVAIHAPEKAAKAAKVKEEPATSAAVGPSTTHCTGANYFKEGEDPLLKADEEYPEWLWGLLDAKEGEQAEKAEQRKENKRKIKEKNFEMAQSSR